MAGDEQIRIDVTAQDDASQVLDDVAESAEQLEKLTPEIAVGADTDAAKRGIEEVTDAAKELSRQDTEILLRARIDDAKGALKALRDDLDQTGDQARRTADDLDRVGSGGGGLSTRGNAIADLTGPLGDASGAASDFAGVFDGLGDIADDVAGKVGVSAATMSTAIGGIGIAVAAAAAVWTLYRQRQEEARRKQAELIEGQRKLNDAVREGKGAEAVEALTETYKAAFDAADRLGVSAGDLTKYLTGQTDALPTLVGKLEELKAQYRDSDDLSGKQKVQLLNLILAYDELVGAIDGSRDAYVQANGAIKEQDARTREVARALGITARETDNVTSANERAESQAKRTADAFDRIETALDINQAALDFQAKTSWMLAETRSDADRTQQEILDIKRMITDVATHAGLTPIEVRSFLERIDQGDVDGVMRDVNAKLQGRAAEVQTSLRPPTAQEYAAMNDQIRRGIGTVYLTAALNNLRSGAYG